MVGGVICYFDKSRSTIFYSGDTIDIHYMQWISKCQFILIYLIVFYNIPLSKKMDPDVRVLRYISNLDKNTLSNLDDITYVPEMSPQVPLTPISSSVVKSVTFTLDCDKSQITNSYNLVLADYKRDEVITDIRASMALADIKMHSFRFLSVVKKTSDGLHATRYRYIHNLSIDSCGGGYIAVISIKLVFQPEDRTKMRLLTDAMEARGHSLYSITTSRLFAGTINLQTLRPFLRDNFGTVEHNPKEFGNESLVVDSTKHGIPERISIYNAFARRILKGAFYVWIGNGIVDYLQGRYPEFSGGLGEQWGVTQMEITIYTTMYLSFQRRIDEITNTVMGGGIFMQSRYPSNGDRSHQ